MGASEADAMFPAIFAITVVGAALYYFAPERQRERILASPFPPEWESFLKANNPLYGFLPPALQKELRDRVKVFLAEKDFEGCGGLHITDEIRVTIAGIACMLLLNRAVGHYPRLKSILVYPSAYYSHDKAEVRLGESWGDGTVALAWDDVKKSARDFRDGHNLVLHEFAHQLDQEDGQADGVPVLEQSSRYFGFAKVMGHEYERLVRLTDKGRKDVLHPYGATNPAEFFAVATETFFEKPKQLAKKHPELYQELKDFFHLDPLSWSHKPSASEG